jgi:hypothetical protein
MDYQQATQLNIRPLWEEEMLAELKRTLSQQQIFEYNDYEAMLPYTPARFSSTFEVIEFGLHPDLPKRTKRLVTIHSYTPLTAPAWV